jgi:hypothetical protein
MHSIRSGAVWTTAALARSAHAGRLDALDRIDPPAGSSDAAAV